MALIFGIVITEKDIASSVRTASILQRGLLDVLILAAFGTFAIPMGCEEIADTSRRSVFELDVLILARFGIFAEAVLVEKVASTDRRCIPLGIGVTS